MTHPFQELAAGESLTDQQLRVLLFVIPELNGREFRPLKQAFIATRLRISQPRVSAALGALVSENLLQAGPRDGPSKTYRVNLTHDMVRALYTRALYNHTA